MKCGMDRILSVLEKEDGWLTFDELYHKTQPDCDWIMFAEVLEELVTQGKVRYSLPYGSDVGCYRIDR